MRTCGSVGEPSGRAEVVGVCRGGWCVQHEKVGCQKAGQPGAAERLTDHPEPVTRKG